MPSRRLASFAFDLLLATAPWASLLGLALGSSEGEPMSDFGLALIFAAVCTLASLVLLAVQTFLFARRGRTLGMALVGLVVEAGSRGRSLVLGVLVFVLPFGVALLASTSMDGDTQKTLLIAAPLASIALELFSALAPDARTLSDRLAGVTWTRDVAPVAARRGAWVDGLVLLMVSAPLLVLVFGSDNTAGAVIATAFTMTIFVTLEAVVFARTRATLAMRALAGRRPP
jgi:RDD family